MKTYSFTEATMLMNFIDENKENIIGCVLKQFHTKYWPQYGRRSLSDIPVVLELPNCCIAINYLIYSDIEIVIGTKDELERNEEIANVINIRNEIIDYYSEEFEMGVKKELIESCKIVDIQIERFSEAFECNGATGEMRPDGGDYFSTIRIYLDSGVVLCLCGVDAISDGYVEVWCE